MYGTILRRRLHEHAYKVFLRSAETMCDGLQAVVGLNNVLFADKNSVILLHRDHD